MCLMTPHLFTVDYKCNHKSTVLQFLLDDTLLRNRHFSCVVIKCWKCRWQYWVIIYKIYTVIISRNVSHNQQMYCTSIMVWLCACHKTINVCIEYHNVHMTEHMLHEYNYPMLVISSTTLLVLW